MPNGHWAWVLAAVSCGLPAQQPDDCLLVRGAFPAAVRDAGDGGELVLDNGLCRATLRRVPDLALVSLRDARGAELLRAVRPCARVVLDGVPYALGGLLGQQDHAFLQPAVLAALTADAAAFHCGSVQRGRIQQRMAWLRTRHAAPDAQWPPPGVELQFGFAAPAGLAATAGVTATWHLELYDDLPLLGVWLELRNGGARALELDACTTVVLAAVEGEARVDPAQTPWRLPAVHVETDYSFGGMTAGDANAQVVHWVADPQYDTQVHYERQTPCQLEVRPLVGPAQTLLPGAVFTSWRTWLLLGDPLDPQRSDLLQRRLYRTLAPWVTENPLMLHVRSADPAAVRLAIDQCHAVGFEMAILSFGSGFDIEDRSAANAQRWRDVADYAHQQGVQLGGYSLLSSRRIEPDGDNCIAFDTGKPGGQRFGFAPALASKWGQDYFAQLHAFFAQTGFDLLEHDGSYPGDFDAAARPPLQKGHADSQWVQWRIISDFYRWCRGRGVYLNVPDYYYLAGGNKCGMGYRETNWSLPRAWQALHARQNLFDGTRTKTPSMGWMFVPLTEYQGGGAPATVEPLSEHKDHYGLMLASNLGYGAQACYRGPRLYDTEATRALVQQWVGWFKLHRDILESDVIHASSRRADGRDLDWVLHANAALAERGMLVVFNPLEQPQERTLPLELYYTGLAKTARAIAADGTAQTLLVDGRGRAQLPVQVGAQSVSWWTFEPVVR